jgi:hypothetical protein
MNVLAAYNILGYTNYNIVNVVNLYNFIISILRRTPPERHGEIVEGIKVHMGMTQFNQFKEYIQKKYEYTHEYVRLVSS